MLRHQWDIKASLEMSLAGEKKQTNKQKILALPQIPPKEIEVTLSGWMLEPTFRHCVIRTLNLKLLLRTIRKPNPNIKGNLLAHIILKRMSQGDLQASLGLQPSDIPRPMSSSSLAHGCRKTPSGLSTRLEKPSSLNTRYSGSPTITGQVLASWEIQFP